MTPFIQSMYDRAQRVLSDESIEFITFYDVEANPSSTTVEKAFNLATVSNVEFVIAIGGGSSIDTAKMVCSNFGNSSIDWETRFKANDYPFGDYPRIGLNPLPLIAISTTSGTGSQCTQAAVITDALSHQKLTVFHPDHFPKEVIVDPELMLTLPKTLTASTSFDAFTHAFESYLGQRLSPFVEMMCEDAIKRILTTLPKVLLENKIEFRESLALADTMAGMCLANGGAQLPHPLSEVIGSALTRLNHGQCLAIVYPEYMRKFHGMNPSKFAYVARLLNPMNDSYDDATAALNSGDEMEKFIADIGLKIDLKQAGLTSKLAQELEHSEVWSHLPMASKEEIQWIVKKSLTMEEENETH